MQKLGILFGLAVVAALAWWWFSSGSELVPAPAAPERTAENAQVAAAVAAGVAPDRATSQGSDEAELGRTQAAVAAGAAPGPQTTVRGRCVDSAGNPIAGCTVGVHGVWGNEKLMESWLRDHEAEPEWTDPAKQTTGTDGRFEFTFWPPPPFQFMLDIEHAQFAAMRARWGPLDAVTVRDVGDVVMATGIRVRGRVVDQAGQPIAKFMVNVHPRRPHEGHDEQLPAPLSSAYGRSDETGAFACVQLLPAGPYHVSTSGRERLLEPIEGTLTATRPVEELTIVVVKKPPGQTITGRVVDDAGRPVADARVEARDANRETRTDRSGRDGTFRIEADHTMTGKLPVTLLVRAEGYEESKPTEPIPFGSTDVVLPLVRSGTLQVRVVDEEQRPIETFQVRVAPRDRPGRSTDDFRVRWFRGPHRDGVAEVPGIGAGKWTVVVDFPKSAGRTSVLQPIEVAARTNTRVELVAARDVSRSVRVVDRSGNPLVGSVVQLCEPLGYGLDADTNRISEEQRYSWQNPHTAIVRAEGKTDATGRVVLSGPPGRTLGVAALGPGHVPKFVGDVLVDVADELVLTVDVGARLRGKIVPPEAVAELERLRGSAAARPWMSLYRDDPRSKVVGQDNPLFAVASDGTFELSGLPPGNWQLLLFFWDGNENGSLASSWMRDVTLQDGRLTEVSLDLAFLLPGTMSGTVTKNGVPAVDAVLSFYVEVPTGRNPVGLNRFARTDADGRYSVRLPRGTCSGNVSTRSGSNWLQVPITVTAAITAGQTTTQDFAIHAGDITVTLLDANGKPVPGVQLLGRSSSGDQVWLPITDDQGRTHLERPVETLQLRVLPRRLATQAARQELAEQHRQNGGTGDPIEPLWIDLGTLGVVAGRTTELERQLPPSFDR